MARNDKLLEKQDPRDTDEYEKLVSKAMLAKFKIETGFLELAESIFAINKKKLYKMRYRTFSEFCEEELGFSRQTIYVYISILKLITQYQEYFTREKVVKFGHKKMRFIAEGVNAIEKSSYNADLKELKKKEIFQKISPQMAATEIEEFIEDIINEL